MKTISGEPFSFKFDDQIMRVKNANLQDDV